MKSTPLYRPVVLVLALSLLSVGAASAQNIDLDEVTAQEELRWGVRAFHNSFYNESILSLSRSLAFEPDNVLARFWLGRSYYHSGFEDAGLREWRTILESGAGTPQLSNFLEIVESRRGLGRELADEVRYVASTSISGVQNAATLFVGPTSVRPRSDGSSYVVGFANHLVQVIDVNGTVRRTLRGGLEGYNRPFDVYEAPDGTILVTEFGADRIAKSRADGTKIGTFGTSGIGAGQLLGPQFIAGNDDGFVYVTDSGNSRVAKFGIGGRYVLSFGEPTAFFTGLRRPVGIAVDAQRVYVLDADSRSVEMFDPSGNHLGSYGGLSLTRPEGLALAPDGTLLLADRGAVLRFDPRTEVLTSIGKKADAMLTSAAIDANGNLLATDFRSDTVHVFTNIDSLYAGLFVRADRVDSNRFPQVVVDVTVQDRSGRPILGLNDRNFLLTEANGPVEDLELVLVADNSPSTAVVFVVERSPAMRKASTQLRDALGKIMEELGANDRRWLVTAGVEPVIDADPTVGDLQFIDLAAEAGDYSTDWSFDLGVRLAGSQLLRDRRRRALLFLTQGELGDGAFSRYGLVELMQYLRNNDVAFYPVYLQDGVRSPELQYLARETGGSSQVLGQARGLGSVIEEIQDRASGRYTFTYVSQSNSDFGRAYIPLEVEAFLLTRSGRDDVGYYAPLEF